MTMDSRRLAIGLASAVAFATRRGLTIGDLPPGACEKLDIARSESLRAERLPSSLRAGKPPQNGAREVARRRRQIERGQLKADNGLTSG